MLKDFLTFLVLALLTTTVSFAQEQINPCGTYGDMAAPIVDRLLENIQKLDTEPVQFRDIQYVPIRFHLVGKSDGSGRMAEQRALDQLCILNSDFADMDIQFYLKGNDYFNYINNTTVYDNHQNTINTFMTFQRDNGALNVYCVNDATPPGDPSPGVTLGYYYPILGKDWIVIVKSEIGNIKSSLTHEIGHFFSLLHPFNGWESEDGPWNNASPAPTLSPLGVPTEKADGSNCNTAGDYLCDTPADYLNGFGWPDCNYTGGAQDPMGVEIDPEERLFMNYFLDCPRDEYFFSPMQQDIILEDLAGFHRNYIRPAFTPPAEVTEAAEPLEPFNETTPAYGSVYFEWAASANASGYLVEIARNSSFTITPSRFITSNTSITISDIFQADRTYYWRVRPFNNLYACVEFSDAVQFETGTEATAVNEIKAVSDWTIEPNPVAKDATVNVRVNANSGFDAQLSLSNIQGQLVRQIGNQRFIAGENRFSISTSGLANGVYLLSIQTDEGQINKRLVVSK